MNLLALILVLFVDIAVGKDEIEEVGELTLLERVKCTYIHICIVG